MISALLYLRWCSARNHLAVRLKRLRQPKYLTGAIFGVLYLYFYFGQWLFRARPAGHWQNVQISPEDALLRESVGALIFFVIVFLAWLIPRKRAALVFTEAEIAFLFPAPVSRRVLIHFKLLRSQIRILFTTLFLTLISRRFGSGPVLFHAAGWWMALSILNLHFLGSSFARTMLMDRGISTWKRRSLVIGTVLLAIGAVAFWAVRALPPLTAEAVANSAALTDYLRQVLVSGPLPYLLFPFRLAIRPYLATETSEFFLALIPALLLLAAHYWWVIRSDVAFEEASLEASQELAKKISAARAGNWGEHQQGRKARRPPFVLRATGFPPVALLWKNLLAAGRAFNLRLLIVLSILVVVFGISMRNVAAQSNWLVIAGLSAAMFGVWTLLIGPQMVRQDLRQDLPNADVLKSFPLRGWQVAVGEILAPAVILTAFQWLLFFLAAAFLSQAEVEDIPAATIPLAIILACLTLPLMNVILLVIPNAAVLLFPAWFQLGRDATQGIEATGQRLMFAFGQLLAFAVALIPAAAVFAGTFFAVRMTSHWLLASVLAGLGVTIVLALEACAGIWWLGWLFERVDLSAEQTNQEN